MTLLLKQLVGGDFAETLCGCDRQAVEQDLDRNGVLVDVAEVYRKLCGPIFCGALLVVFIVVVPALVFRCRDLERKSPEPDGKGGLGQVGAPLDTPNRILTESSLRRPSATATGVSTLAVLSYVIAPNEASLSGGGWGLLDFGDDVIGTHTSVDVANVYAR
jgi:hypothetical protein